MPISNVLEINHLLLHSYLQTARCVVDATVGNGYDSEKVLQNAPLLQYLFCCDIQPSAIHASQQRLACRQSSATIFWYEINHAMLFQNFPLLIDIVFFNLGYLPGGDHTIHTRPKDTILACTTVLKYLRKGGIMSLVSYPGTEAGAEEYQALRHWSTTLSQQQWHIAYIEMPNQIHNPPCLFLIEKR